MPDVLPNKCLAVKGESRIIWPKPKDKIVIINDIKVAMKYDRTVEFNSTQNSPISPRLNGIKK